MKPDSLRFKVLIRSFCVLQVGDLEAQMTLQGRDGMSSCRCIKYNLTMAEWKSVRKGTIIKKDELTLGNNLLLGQKRLMLWGICPSDFIIPLLHC